MAAVEVEAEQAAVALLADNSPPTPNSFSLNRVGTWSGVDAKNNADLDSSFYVLGSIGRLCNEVDDITLESGSTRTARASDSPELPPINRQPTLYNRDTPVFSWESRTTTLVDDGSSIEQMLQKRRPTGSSLAPQSSSDPSDDERSEAPSVGQFRPGTDLIQCPVEGCERTFKWKKNLHHHIRDKHPTDAAGLSVMRIQPAHVGAAHNGFRLQSIAIAPPPTNMIGAQGATAMLPPGVDPSLRCPECGKTFSRKGDLVHHKRYHTRSTDRPYKCEQCGQGFIHHKDLARHMPRHTGQRSFQCPFPECHKNYTRKDNLNRHMRHDHGGLGASGEVWTGNDIMPVSVAPPQHPMQMHPIPIPPPQQQSRPQEIQYEPPIDPAMPIHNHSHLAAIAEAATNHALLQDPNTTHQQPYYPHTFAESSLQHQHHDQPVLHHETTPQNHIQDTRMESSSEDSMPNGHTPTPHLHPGHDRDREATPSSLGKRRAPSPTSDPLLTGSSALKPKRAPKQKWAHRLGCPFRKCRPGTFTTENGFRVCETTPHEFIIRLIEHMKRNHELFVCGECFLGYRTPEALTEHKSSSHHCGRCYLSFADSNTFIAHASTCKSVEAATQEDIWQILYETLCGDGIRHNPSFDEDVPAQGSNIAPNNRIRMQILANSPLAPGQVPSLARQLSSPSPSGNARAPPVVRQGDDFSKRGHHPGPEGASALLAPDIITKRRDGTPDVVETARVDSGFGGSSVQGEAIAVLQRQLAFEKTARIEAEQRVELLTSLRTNSIVRAAIRQFTSSIKRSVVGGLTPAFGSGFVEELDFSDQKVEENAPWIPSFSFSNYDEVAGPSIAVATSPTSYLPPHAPLEIECPSLTSEVTAPSIDDFVPPPNLGRSLSNIVADFSKENARGLFTWGQQNPWECQNCGVQLAQATDVFCEACAQMTATYP